MFAGGLLRKTASWPKPAFSACIVGLWSQNAKRDAMPAAPGGHSLAKPIPFWDEVRKGKMQSLILKLVVLGYIGVTAYAVHVYSWPLAAATADRKSTRLNSSH